MKKLFYLAAMALSLGFTACSDDDDKDSQMVSETYKLKFDVEDFDSVELNAVVKAYATAMGKQDLAEVDSVTIEGKDTAATNATILAQMSQAESLLKGKSFSSNPTVELFNTSGRIYSRCFSEGVNSATELKFDRLSNYDTVGDTVGMITVTLNKRMSGMANSIDLNKYTVWGDQVRICAHSTRQSNTKPVTDILLWVRGKNQELKRYITYLGITYQIAYYQYNPTTIDDGKVINLNMNTGGPELYLYYTNDESMEPLYLPGLAVCYKYYWAVFHIPNTYYECDYNDFKQYFNRPEFTGFTPDVVRLYYTDEFGNITTDQMGMEAANFNYGVGGSLPEYMLKLRYAGK